MAPIQANIKSQSKKKIKRKEKTIMENKTITITGKGKKSYRPDQIIISMNYEKISNEYDEALAKAAEYTNVLKKEAMDAGVEESKIITKSFLVSPHEERYKGKDEEYHYRFAGYRTSISYAIKIPMDNKLLSKVLFALKDHKGEFRINYSLENQEKANDEVMEEAVKDAIRQANILTKVANQTLGEIINISHSYGRIEVEREYDSGICLEASHMDIEPEFSVNPDDINVADTVNITWALR